MQRIMVIGCCGAGKSTFSKKLRKATDLPLYHLDKLYWKPNWVETEKDEWTSIVSGLAEKPQWIIDGNYGRTMDIRMKKADTVIFLDYPTLTCLWRITKRTLTQRQDQREDMGEGCDERFDLNFYHYVALFNITKRKGIFKMIDSYKEDKEIFVFKNDRELDQFLRGLNN